MDNSAEKHFIWGFVICLIAVLAFIVIMYASSHPFIIKFEMDNNTLEAMKLAVNQSGR